MSRYIDSNTQFQPITISNSVGVSNYLFERTKDATHVIIYLQEDAASAWTAPCTMLPVGRYRTNVFGRGVAPSVQPSPPFRVGCYGYAESAAVQAQVTNGATGAFPGRQAPFMIPFREFDEVGLSMQATGGSPEAAQMAVVMVKEPINGFPADMLAQLDFAIAATTTGMAGAQLVGVDMTIEAEAGNAVDVALAFVDEQGNAVAATGMKCLVSLVDNGGSLLPASGGSGWPLSSGDGGSTVVQPVGTPGLGLYEVTAPASGTAQVTITDSAGGRTKTINVAASMLSAGSSGLEVDASNMSDAGNASFS
jgi:hypothetical protein